MPASSAAAPRGTNDLAHPAVPFVPQRVNTCRSLLSDGATIDKMMIERLHVNPDLAMLLAVYEGEAEGRDMFLFKLAQAATAPSSTAHRKLGEMIRLGMLERSRTARDHRLVRINLAPAMRDRIDAMLDAIASGRSAPRA
jgi:DNA-binding MarR family transcriptional regulator